MHGNEGLEYWATGFELLLCLAMLIGVILLDTRTRRLNEECLRRCAGETKRRKHG